MKYVLAQLNIAEFKVPQDDPVNADFINNLDRVNAIAESQPGFIWRFTGEGNDAMDVSAFDNPNIAVNMSTWESVGVLKTFVYKNTEHKEIMRRRKEWFHNIEFHLVLWWVEQDRTPTIEEATLRLNLLKLIGPSHSAFNFAKPFAAPV
jgi:hypothetical protein